MFEYMGFHFEPAGKVKGDFFSITRNCGGALLSKADINQSDNPLFEANNSYSYEGFYKAANSEDDIFRCKEDGRVYVPAENYLFQYMGKEAHLYD
jgi:hypothetical protein